MLMVRSVVAARSPLVCWHELVVSVPHTAMVDGRFEGIIYSWAVFSGVYMIIVVAWPLFSSPDFTWIAPVGAASAERGWKWKWIRWL